MDNIVDDIKRKIGSKENIDAVLVVFKATEYRKTIQELKTI
jgi:hypothetical protein